jgi:hypothetical protein
MDRKRDRNMDRRESDADYRNMDRRKIDKHDRDMDRKEAWTERPKHGQKRSMDRKKWQRRPKHGHNRSTDRKNEKTRPKTWTEKAEKSEKHHRNTDRKRGKHDRNMDRKLDNDLLRKKLVSFLLKEQNKQTNKTQKDKQ